MEVGNIAMTEAAALERAEKGAEASSGEVSGVARYGEQYAPGWERSRSRTQGLDAQLEASGEFEQVKGRRCGDMKKKCEGKKLWWCGDQG